MTEEERKTLECPGCGDFVKDLLPSATVWHRCPARRNKPTWYENAPEAQTQATG